MTAGHSAEPASPGVVKVFLGFALAYFLSALLRAVTATLAPVFSSELGLRASDLGLLAGAYFFGFALMQLPLGAALDRMGPKRVVTALLGLAVLGCVGFSVASNLSGLIAARMLIGIGVAACLMAPLTCFRRLMSPAVQLRANSWMLMTGSLGMVASTVPVQWLLPHWGWRGLFVALALALAGALLLIQLWVPTDAAVRPSRPESAEVPGSGYREIVCNPLFRRLAPLGFFAYGGLIAVQALWAGPWLTRVCGWSGTAAAQGLLSINLAMLFAFLGWGALLPRLAGGRATPVRLMAWGLPASLSMLVLIAALGPRASAGHWMVWCVCTSFVTLSQPAVGQAFALQLAGRALSAFNLVIFSGVFALQWGIGFVIDLLTGMGWSDAQAFQAAFAGYAACCVAAYAWFVAGRPGPCR